MNPAHVHLIAVHMPILFLPLAILIFLWGIKSSVSQVKSVALMIMIASGAVSIPSFFSGEKAEAIVEELPGVDDQYIEQHEEMAEIAFPMTVATGVLALFGLLLQRINTRLSSKVEMVILLVAILTSAILMRTGNLGGKIRHSELRDGAATGQAIENKESEKDE